MTHLTFHYYQCLVCKCLFENSWKVQVHLNHHFNQEVANVKSTNGPGSKRGMLPIQKVTFADCYVPLVRNQIDPEFLKTYEQLLSYDDNSDNENCSKLSPGDTSLNRKGCTRPRRRCQLEATAKLKQITALLKRPERLPSSSNLDSGSGNRNDSSDNISSNDNSSTEDCSDSDIERQLKLKTPRRQRGRPRKTFGLHKPKQRDKDDSDKIPQLSCPLPTCKKTFKRGQLDNHIQRHLNAESKEIIFSSSPNHLEKYSKTGYFHSKQFHCKFCMEKVLSLSELQEHLINFHKEVFLECPHCKNGNDKAEDYQSNITSFIEHLRSQHQKQYYPPDQNGLPSDGKHLKCEQCQYRCDNPKRLQGHVDNVHKKKKGITVEDINNGQVTHSCPVCKRLFLRKDNLRRHFNLHLETNPFICSFPGCGVKFNSSYNLKRHSAFHNPEFREAAKVSCPHCEGVFSRKQHLAQHIASRHNNDMSEGKGRLGRKYRKIRIFSIKSQGQITSENVESLPIVQDVIKGEIAHEPDILKQPDCLSTSSSSHSATMEEKVAEDFSLENDPIYKEIMEKAPNEAKSLLKKKYCNSKKIFTCRICKAKFFRAFTLQRHLNSFHGKSLINDIIQKKAEEKSREESESSGGARNVTLLCGTCAYPATDEKDLSLHIKTHLKQHWTCKWNDCRQIFDYYVQICSHLRKVHPEAPQFPCRFCDETFLSVKRRDRHTKALHWEQWTEANKKWTCELCNKSFLLRGYVYHMRVAHGKNSKELLRAKCMLCHDTFADFRVLQRHIDCLHLGKDYNKVANAKYYNRTLKSKSSCEPKGSHNENQNSNSNILNRTVEEGEAKSKKYADDQGIIEEMTILGV